MGTIILSASILIWALGYFPRSSANTATFENRISVLQNTLLSSDSSAVAEIENLRMASEADRLENSFIGRIGHFITPVIEPLGYDWKIGVSIVTGLAAKEIVVGTMGVLYQTASDNDENTVGLQQKLQQQVFTSGTRAGEKVFTPWVAFSLMLFVLVYFPCVAVIAAIKREANWKWAVFTMVYTTFLAWVVALGTTLIGKMF
jgi:ferrous iron transport protein B